MKPDKKFIKKALSLPWCFLFIILVCLSTVLLFDASNEDDDADKLNIVVIVSDALRSDMLGCYGGDVETPNINRLAEEGTVFENAHSTAPSTMPSSVSMLTGNYSNTYDTVMQIKNPSKHTKRYAFYVNNKEPLLGKALKSNGYDVICDIENKIAACSNNFQGFSQFRMMSQMTEEEIDFVQRETGIRNIGFVENSPASSNYDHMYDLLNYILSTPGDKPFFIVKWIRDPHAQYHPPKEFFDKIPVDVSRLRGNIDRYTMERSNWTHWHENSNDYERWFLKCLYKAEVESVDQRVGFIMDALERSGRLENTLVVFTSDHGELFGEHNRWGHGHNFYQEALNVPLIFCGPGIPKGKRVNQYVSLLDLMPTLKELVGAQYSDDTQGKSFHQIFSNGEIKDRILYFDRISNNLKGGNADSHALIMDGYKLTVTKIEDSHKKINKTIIRLYNLETDPGEKKNLTEEKPEILKKMMIKINTLRRQNKKRMHVNMANTSDKDDMHNKNRKALDALKSLGYIK